MSVIKIITHQILGSGHRRYDGVELLGIKSDNAITLGYARFSSHDQKTDLETQKQVLELFCAQQGWQHQVIEDLGSGLNYSKRSRERSIKMIIAHQVKKLGLTDQDRLLRFSSELTFSLWEHFSPEVVMINRTENASYEEDFAEDIREIITVFSARV